MTNRRPNTELERRRNSDRFFELANEMFCILDQSGHFVQVNPAFYRMLGAQPTEQPDQVWSDILIGEDQAEGLSFLEEVSAHAPETVQATLRCHSPDHGQLWVDWSAQQHEDDLIYVSGHDVTVAREAQRRSDELSHALDQVNQELQEFVFVSSHDLQEPLRKIRAFGDRIMIYCEAQLDDRGKDYLMRMDAAAGRMQQLIDDLLSYSRVTTQAKPLQEVDLKKVVQSALSNLELRVQDQKAVVSVTDLPLVQGDASQLQQVFQNLLSNALKFVPADTTPDITVEAKPIGHSDQIEVTVADRGIGIDTQYRERIFAPFQRLHSRQEYAGSGIGLAIVRKIIQRHGGDIRAECNPGGGTRMVMRLSRAHPSVDDASATQ